MFLFFSLCCTPSALIICSGLNPCCKGDCLSFKKLESHHLNLIYRSSCPQNCRHSVIKHRQSLSILNVFKSNQEGILKTATSSKGKELSLSTDLFINTALQKTTDNCNGANSSSSIAITPSGLSGTAQGISFMKEN